MPVRPRNTLRAGCVLVFALQATGCVGLSTVRSLPADAGHRAEYLATVEEVSALVPDVLDEMGHEVIVDEATDSGSHTVLASQPMGLFSNGQHTRALLWTGPGGGTSELRVAARSRSAMDVSGRANRVEPRIIRAVDEALGPSRIAPFPGLTVRGTVPGRDREVRGVVETSGTDGLTLMPRGFDPTPVPLRDLTDAAVLRGSYRHGPEGSVVGLVVAVVALLAAQPQCPTTDVCFEPLAYMAGGTLAGFLVGSAFRTEIWSPASFGPEAAGSGP